MARAGGGGSRNQSRSRSPHGWCTYLSTQGFPVELSSSSTSSSSNAPVADTGLGKFLGKLLGKFLGNLRCLHIMHTDAGPRVGFSELRDVLAQSMAAYASDGEDALNETEHCAPEELHADILEPPPEILVGDGQEEVGDGEVSETNSSEEGNHAEAEVEVADETVADGAFATPAHRLPPISGCRLQKRAPDSLYRVWYPGAPSHSESWRPDSGQSMEEAHDACLRWAWGKHNEGLHGA